MFTNLAQNVVCLQTTPYILTLLLMTLLGRAPGSSLHLRLALTLTTCASTPCRLKVLCSICGVGAEKNSSPDIIKKEGQNLSTEHRNRFFPS